MTQIFTLEGAFYRIANEVNDKVLELEKKGMKVEDIRLQVSPAKNDGGTDWAYVTIIYQET